MEYIYTAIKTTIFLISGNVTVEFAVRFLNIKSGEKRDAHLHKVYDSNACGDTSLEPVLSYYSFYALVVSSTWRTNRLLLSRGTEKKQHLEKKIKGSYSVWKEQLATIGKTMNIYWVTRQDYFWNNNILMDTLRSLFRISFKTYVLIVLANVF